MGLPMKRSLFFADLNYINPGKEWTIIPFPLNVGYLASFTQKMCPDDFDIKIFKDPAKLLHALETETPDAIAFSNYIWNQNLTLGFAELAREMHPSCVIAMGGPNYNFAEIEWVESFARKNKFIDFHIDGEGEVKLYNLMACCLQHDFDIAAVKAASPVGVTYIDPVTDQMVANLHLREIGKWTSLDELDVDFARGRLLNLDDVPSPYLNGQLDDFLSDPDYCPIIETNRGCPYSCTFCNWGAMGKSKSASFSLDRVMDELEFIAEHNVSKTPYLYIGDANFGLFPRDVEIAQKLRELKDEHGFPQNVYMYFAKNSSEKVVKIAEILKDMTPISLSRQTQNEEVLDNIRRSNISIDTFNSLAELAKKMGIDSNVELIFGLPGESKESFYGGVQEVAKQKVDGLHIFPAMLLNGSEMGTQKSRERYGLSGKWRFIDGCAGIYGPVKSMEFEEIVTESSVMSESDYFELRLFHFLQTLFLDTKIYKETALLLGDLTIVDLIMDITAHYKQAPKAFRQLMDEFIAQAGSELHSTKPSEFSEENINAALTQSVKLNPLYICRVLYEDDVREAFHQFLAERILYIGAATEEEIAGILEFIDASIYPFDGAVSRNVQMSFDAVAYAIRPPFAETNISDFLLAERSSFHYVKPFTYEDHVAKERGEVPLWRRAYEVLVHHTHETFRNTLLYRLRGKTGDLEAAGEAELTSDVRRDDNRIIRLEGGWLY